MLWLPHAGGIGCMALLVIPLVTACGRGFVSDVMSAGHRTFSASGYIHDGFYSLTASRDHLKGEELK